VPISFAKNSWVDYGSPDDLRRAWAQGHRFLPRAVMQKAEEYSQFFLDREEECGGVDLSEAFYLSDSLY
jgi:hypothetical protein